MRAIWNAPTTLLRAVFDAVFVRVDRETSEACITLTWQGGATSELKVRMPRMGEHSVMDDEKLIDDIRRMAAHLTDKQIARALNARAIRTTSGLPSFRRRHGIEVCRVEAAAQGEPVYTAQDAARELGVSLITVLRWLKEGFLAGDQVAPYAPWQIRLPDSVRLKTAPKAPEGRLPIRQAASALRVSTGSVYIRSSATNSRL